MTLAGVLWWVATIVNTRRERPLGPVNRADFEAADPSDAAPTIPVRAAAEWLATRSHWGQGQNLGPTDELVAEQMVERLAAGDLNAWGRRTPESSLVRLRPAAFATGLIDLPEDTLFIVNKDATYYDLQLDEHEMKRTWPAGTP
jgi:hypothetical protein